MTTYIVKEDDTLYYIAQRHRVALTALIAANQHITDPDFICPGDRIHIPAGLHPGQLVWYTAKSRSEEAQRRWYKAIIICEVTKGSPCAHFTSKDACSSFPRYLLKTKAGHYQERGLQAYEIVPCSPTAPDRAWASRAL